MGFAYAFYVSNEWKHCREGFVKFRQGLCERCLMEGYYVPGTQVHHKIRLTPKNITDPNVALNWDNLELLCDSCHEKEHNKTKHRADCNGHVEL